MEATTQQEDVRISVHLPADLHHALKRMTVEERTTIQSLALGWIKSGVYEISHGTKESNEKE